MFDWLYKLIGDMLALFSNAFGGYYALALLLYAILFKIVFLPFGIKQQKNQIKMAKLQPKIELIKAKYKGRTDQPTMQKMQQEIMEFQQQEGYSPFSGCLPLILQMIIIVPLYRIIRSPLTYICDLKDSDVSEIYKLINNAELEFAKIDQINLISSINSFENKAALENLGLDFAKLPNFYTFGLNLADKPELANISWLVLIPVIAAALTWLSMFLTRKWNGNTNPAAAGADAQANASMKMMDIMMPAMTLFFAFSFSGMLGLYWIYQSALGILQTFVLSKAMPLPKYTEEELKEMRKAQKAAEKAQREALKGQPKYRSLHYIDDDDYEELPVLKNEEETNKGETKAPGGMDIPDIKD